MDWKTILALAVLVAPLAYCGAHMDDSRWQSRARIAEACFAAGGTWTDSWGGSCEAPK